ncbi:MAG: hypothetical protein A2V93_08330 [Ignavibacteria bacterium RBG_16_34_14]|nr:MAG: hypothetical protein A2V93_08330 [Ignavibacteria bacterium RBG_16_34_14]
MIPDLPSFNGFHEECFKFFAELSENNSLTWFAQNRERYNNYIVLTAKTLINSLAPFFNQIEPKINTEPKFDKTMLRINKDARFSNGVPYRPYFFIHFRRFKKDSEFYIYIDKKGIEYGLFINNTLGNELYFNKNLPGHKDGLVETFRRLELNGKFDFYEMNKEPELITKGFNIENDFNRMARTKFFLLQKEMSKESEIIYSSDILLKILKTFSQLYPVYCFSISHNPLAIIEKFEEEIGIPR